jgi:hypothetical protein
MKYKLLIIFWFLTLSLYAPSPKYFLVVESNGTNPFEKIYWGVNEVESKQDSLAYNPLEEAVGKSQIRPIRLEDYNRRTGNSYRLVDMYNPEISRKVFMYYASQIGPYDKEKIIRDWNGSGSMTYTYLDSVKSKVRKRFSTVIL